MNDTTTTAIRPRRRFRLTLGVMMALVLASGGGIGWVAHRARVQRDAVAAILKDNRGSVRYDWQVVENRKRVNRTPKGPKWLRDAIGPDVFDSVTFVGLEAKTLDDALMAQVGRLDRVESLNIQGPLSASLSPAGMGQVRHLRRLRSLTIQGAGDPRGFLPGLAGKTGMLTLRVAGAALTDRDMETIGTMTDLEELEGGGEGLSEAGFAHLAPLKKLKFLALRKARISSLAALEGMKDLQRLLLEDTRLPREDLPPVRLAPLRESKKLEAIGLVNPVDDRDLEVLKDLRGLRSVWLVGRGITQKGLDSLAQLPSLNGLTLCNTSVHDLRPLGPTVARVMFLDLRGSPIDDEGLKAIEGAPRLQTVFLNRSRITDEGLGTIATLPALQVLGLDGTAITDAGLARLALMKNLSRLGLGRTRITDAGLPHLAGMTKLKNLNLGETSIGDAGLAHLVAIPSLATLILGESALTDAGRGYLAKLPSLRGVYVVGGKPDDATRTRLAKALPTSAITYGPYLDR